uniref:Polyketide synthase n=1 Tax=Peronospora matthiolae TaxID=2874970 RepID=A0AAV1UFX0_9STRA
MRSIGAFSPLHRCNCALRVCFTSTQDTHAMRLWLVRRMPDAGSRAIRSMVSNANSTDHWFLTQDALLDVGCNVPGCA